MDKNAKIYVAGHNGLVGSAIVRHLKKQGFCNLLLKSHSELELTDQNASLLFFEKEKPEYVFLAAAKVGGIMANDTYPADFIYQNLMIQNNVIHNSYITGVKKLLFLGSSCIYPKNAPQPIKEEYLLEGKLEPTNEPYAIAKIAGIEMCWAYNRQYKTSFLPVMPTNLYGPGDNFDLETSHVLPALIRKFHEAKIEGKDKVVVWGTGMARREFLYVDDLADACVFLMRKENIMSFFKDNRPLANIGTGVDIAISDLADIVKKIVGFKGGIEYDTTMPDGAKVKLLDVSNIKSWGWKPITELEQGLLFTYDFYCREIGAVNSIY